MPDLIYERLTGDRIPGEHTERLIASAERADVVVCGNGIGTESHEVVLSVAPHCRKAVFDADALRSRSPKACGETVYTPMRGNYPYIRCLAFAGCGRRVREGACGEGCGGDLWRHHHP